MKDCVIFCLNPIMLYTKKGCAYNFVCVQMIVFKVDSITRSPILRCYQLYTQDVAYEHCLSWYILFLHCVPYIPTN